MRVLKSVLVGLFVCVSFAVAVPKGYAQFAVIDIANLIESLEQYLQMVEQLAQLKAQLELLRRRIFLAKAERIDTRQLEIEFAETQAKLVKLATELGEPAAASGMELAGSDSGRPARPKPKARGAR